MSEKNEFDLLAEELIIDTEIKEETTEEVLEEVVEPETVVEDVITVDVPEKTGKGMGIVGDGTIGSTVVKNKPKANKPKVEAKAEVEKVAIHSTRNVTWSEVGKVYRGYNIVTKQQADKWLTRDHIRLATPEEVAKEFGL